MTEQNVQKKEQEAVQKTATTQRETVYVPDVDISENSECIRLVADMPGVEQGSVDVSVENNVMTVEGTARFDPPEGYELVGQEYGVGKYRRDFTLSDEVDTDGIKARIRHGVLEVTLPKRDEVKTKKIEIEA